VFRWRCPFETTQSIVEVLQMKFGVFWRDEFSRYTTRKGTPVFNALVCCAFQREIQEVVMNVRHVVSPVLALLLATYAPGQPMSQEASEIGQSMRAPAPAGAFRQDLQHRITLKEAEVRQAESAHATNVQLSILYVQLGLLYQDVALWEKSEATLKHAVSLLRQTAEQSANLASALGQLGCLHIAMEKLGESEKEELEALSLRQALGNRLQIARSWSDLAALYLHKRKFVKARDFAQQAVAEFVTNEKADVLDRMSARFALSQALCYLKDCPSAIPLLKAALDDAKATLPPDSFTIGESDFILGYAYWKVGDIPQADAHMERGAAQMNVQLGWGHPVYFKALAGYAQFLRENHRVEAANVVEGRIRQAAAVVDVHSLQTGQGAFGFK
jgi:tetratricopeptide (TPR) repeat protein